ncbi:hypothetical protein A3Q56_03092, partial [Intoshia linei]
MDKYRDIFSKCPGKTEIREHEIRTIPGSSPICIKPYPTPIHHKDIEINLIKEMIRNKIIEPSNSSYNSPHFLKRKPNGTYRFLLDYRKL